MRLLFLAIALAACSSDPAPPVDSGMHVDQQPDTGWPWADVGDVAGDDRMALPDFGPRDAGVDVVTKDWPFEDRPAPMDVADVPVVDAGADAGGGADVPGDVRVNCDGGSPDAAAYLCGGVCCAVACCNGVCADTQSNPGHCGGCEVSCGTAPHAVLSCRSGSCAVSACSAPFADCNGGFGDGCETNTLTDPRHCGNCATSCDPYPHTTGSCALGRCEYECVSGFADCDGLQTTGCEREVGDGGRCP